MKLTVDIIAEVVASLSYQEPIKSITSIGTDADGREGWEIEVCKTRHLIECFNIELDGKNYKIESITNDSKVVVREVDTGTGQPAITELPVSAPNYKHGTAIDVNNELVRIEDHENKYPLVYLLEPFTEDFENGFDSAVNRTSQIRLFCLAPFNKYDWLTDDHYMKVIQPMNNLCDELLEYFETPGNGYGEFDGHRRTNYVNLSIQKTLKGGEIQIFDDYLSGTELGISLPIKNNCLNLGC